jgi:phosphatidylglycerol:prolipoprotein diacylglycerol transferase
MIPYFIITTIHIGPIPVQVWGLMVAFGILAGVFAASKMAQCRGLNKDVVWDLAAWVMVGAFVGARVAMLAYTPEVYLSDPFELLRVWHGGFSIFGGFIGALTSGIWFLKKRNLGILSYSDIAVFGLPLGIFVGRIGCFLIHDHPGRLTDFLLGVRYVGGTRHDLGLYDCVVGLVLFMIFLMLARRKTKVGAYVVVFSIGYALARFFFDFLRATDVAVPDARYFGLTPAQYAAIIMLMFGAWVWAKLKTKTATE